MGASNTGGAATGGAAMGGSSFWGTITYSSTGLPDVPSGQHNPGRSCMSCHTATGPAPYWYFAGTIYAANGLTAAPNVQVGVSDGSNLYTAYSAMNGNFYLRTVANINWANAQVHIRNANGEKIMTGAIPSPDCNSCHTGTGTARIIAP
jgi:hypothetical protein